MDELHFNRSGELIEFNVEVDRKTARFVKEVLKHGKITGNEVDNSKYTIIGEHNNWESIQLTEFETKDYISFYKIEVLFEQDDTKATLFFEFPNSTARVRSTLIIDKFLGGHLDDC